MPGPVPKPARTRRRANTPKSYGAATPITAPAAPVQDRKLGLDAPVHPMIRDMWAALAQSCESAFYSPADWERARFELWHCNQLLVSGKPIGAASWQQVQRGLGDLLVSPAEKRRCGVDVRPVGSDPDADAAVSMTAKYQQKLAVVKESGGS